MLKTQEITLSSFKELDPNLVKEAAKRVSPYLNHTPLIESRLLNNWLGHRIIFKAECLQRTGAFKARGALNALLTLKEQGNLPHHIAAFSSGNHAQAVAWACSMLGVKSTIYLPKIVSPIKKQATISYGADVVEAQTRKEAEALTDEAAKNGAYIIPPFDHDDVILGQGTACFEALSDSANPDAVFSPCGGGGLTSGTLLASRLFSKKIDVFAVEPKNANDAAISVKTGKIFRFEDSPDTIADGARTLGVSERTFHYLKQCAGIYEIEEEEIIYWSQWISHLLKVSCETTSAMAMAASYKWLKTQTTPKTALIILSGGNIDPSIQKKIWEKNYLDKIPAFK